MTNVTEQLTLIWLIKNCCVRMGLDLIISVTKARQWILTPWSRVLEKPVVTQPVKKFLAFHGT